MHSTKPERLHASPCFSQTPLFCCLERRIRNLFSQKGFFSLSPRCSRSRGMKSMIQQYGENMEQWESLANLSEKLIWEGKKGQVTKKETIKLYFRPIKLFNMRLSHSKWASLTVLLLGRQNKNRAGGTNTHQPENTITIFLLAYDMKPRTSMLTGQ